MSPRDALTYGVGAVGLLLLAGALVAGAGFLWLLWGLAVLVGAV
jgi:hypothetical protein